MVNDALKSVDMSPKEYAPVWRCRHCKHKWLIEDEDNPPKQCPNRKCRAMDWDRKKVLPGRPRKPKPKGQAGKPKKGKK